MTGWRLDAATDTRITARSAVVFDPTSVALTVCPSLKVTWICRAPAMTCALVRMLPFVSSTIPEPIAWPLPRVPLLTVAVIVTTPGETCL